LSDSLQGRFERAVQFIPLNTPGGIVKEFVSRSDLPMPDGWETWSAPSVNRSPQGLELGLYAALNEAIAVTVAASPSGVDLLETDEVRTVRGFLGRLISRGDHHRQPIRMDVDEQFRLDLLGYFINELEGALLAEVVHQEARKSVESAIRAARVMLKGSDEGVDLARRWEEGFLTEARTGATGAEAKLRTWCERSGRTDVEGLLLPA
jgi:hypothetical protein